MSSKVVSTKLNIEEHNKFLQLCKQKKITTQHQTWYGRQMKSHGCRHRLYTTQEHPAELLGFQEPLKFGVCLHRVLQLPFAQEYEALAAQDLTGEMGIVGAHREGGCSVGSHHERIGVVNIQFGGEQCGAYSRHALFSTQFHHQNVTFGKRKVTFREQLTGPVSLGGHNAHDGMI